MPKAQSGTCGRICKDHFLRHRPHLGRVVSKAGDCAFAGERWHPAPFPPWLDPTDEALGSEDEGTERFLTRSWM